MRNNAEYCSITCIQAADVNLRKLISFNKIEK